MHVFLSLNERFTQHFCLYLLDTILQNGCLSTPILFCRMKNSSVIHLKKNKDTWVKNDIMVTDQMTDLNIWTNLLIKKGYAWQPPQTDSWIVNKDDHQTQVCALISIFHSYSISRHALLTVYKWACGKACQWWINLKKDHSVFTFIWFVRMCGANRAWCWMIQVSVCKWVSFFTFVCSLYEAKLDGNAFL